jgi:hypothetical protein
VLSFSQIALYLGAFLLACGGILYFAAYERGGVSGLVHPFTFLALPVFALATLALRLDRGEHKATAVAFHLGAAVLVPPLLLIVLKEASWLTALAGEGRELFLRVTNRQPCRARASAAFSIFPALRTRTVALASAVAPSSPRPPSRSSGTSGLQLWLENERWTSSESPLPLLVVAAPWPGHGSASASLRAALPLPGGRPRVDHGGASGADGGPSLTWA